MRRKLVAVLVVGAALVAVPVAGANAGHGNCSAFGADISSEAKAFRPLGQLVKQIVPVNGIIAEEHTALCG